MSALLLLAAPLAVQGQFTYITNCGAITITGYTGPGGNVMIPATINGLPVTDIGSGAFYDSGLTNVTIPGSVTAIEAHAFSGTRLTTVTIPSSVIYLEGEAFAPCPELTTIFFAGNAPSIDSDAFSWGHFNGDTFHRGYDLATIYYLYGTTGWSNTFSGLSTIMLNAPPQSGTTADGYKYISDGLQIIITGYFGTNNVVAIPSSMVGLPLTGIASYAFYNNSLISVTIPDSVVTVGERTFENCYSLTSVTIGNGLTTIGNYMFYDADLMSVIIPDSVTNIGDYAFSCDGEFHFSTLTNVTMGNSVTSIGDYAFGSCDDLTSVTIPNSVTSIGEGAFYGTSLTSVTIPDGVTSIEDSVFTGCNSLTNVVIPDSIKSIGMYAFEFCSSLTCVTIPDSVTNLGGYCLYACWRLTAITVSAQNPSYSSIDGVLFNKDKTTLLTYPAGHGGGYSIPDGVTNIGESAFEFTGLTSVTIGNSVVSIGGAAFYDCPGLTNVTLGESIASIDGEAFDGCYSLIAVYFQGNAPNADPSIFGYGFDHATIYYLPGTLGWSNTFAGLPTALWFLPQPLILSQSQSFGAQSNKFGFTISWATNVPVVVEACSNLSHPLWLPVSTNALVAGTSYFSDPQWTKYPQRFYRLTTP